MTCKGYTATVEYSEEDGCLIGWLIGMRDIVAFDAVSVHELRKQFHKAVEHYLWASEKLGLAPEKPHSGRMMVRVAPELHARAAVAAKSAGQEPESVGEPDAGARCRGVKNGSWRTSKPDTLRATDPDNLFTADR